MAELKLKTRDGSETPYEVMIVEGITIQYDMATLELTS